MQFVEEQDTLKLIAQEAAGLFGPQDPTVLPNANRPMLFFWAWPSALLQETGAQEVLGWHAAEECEPLSGKDEEAMVKNNAMP
eukprot:gene4955-4431_t